MIVKRGNISDLLILLPCEFQTLEGNQERYLTSAKQWCSVVKWLTLESLSLLLHLSKTFISPTV